MGIEEKYKVSIIIPVYAVSAYIERCIKSVMCQTYENVECIIVDDVTPDDSIIKCEQMIAAYQGPIHFNILHHDHNRGLSAARNTGTDAATGDYIFYFDSDDELTPDCIEKLIRPVLTDETIEMVMGNIASYSEYDLQGPKLLRKTNLPEEDIASNENVRQHCYTKKEALDGHAWNKLVKRDILLNHSIRFREGLMWEDIPWFFAVLKHLKHLYLVSDHTISHYIRPQSITTGICAENRARHLGKVYEEIARHFTSEDQGKEARYYLKGFCGTLVYNYKNPIAYQVADLFKEALSDGPFWLDRLYLAFSVFLSRSAIGRRFFVFVRDIRKRDEHIG